MIQDGYGRYEYMDTVYYQYPMLAGQELQVLRIITDAITEDTIKSLALNFKTGETEGLYESILKAISSALSGDALHSLIGTVILAEGESQNDLWKVQSFTDRGRRMVFSMPGGLVEEMLDDFFSLNRERITAVLERFGLTSENVVATFSGTQKKNSSVQSKPSRKGGGSTRK